MDSTRNLAARAGRWSAQHRKKAIPEKAPESVLIQSRRGAASTGEPEFRAVVNDVVSRLERTRHLRNVASPYGPDAAGLLSEDGRSALVTFELPGDDAEEKVDPSLDAVAALADQHPGYRIEQFGDGSAAKALTQAFEDDFQRAEVTSLPTTLVILIVAFGALLAAFVGPALEGGEPESEPAAAELEDRRIAA